MLTAAACFCCVFAFAKNDTTIVDTAKLQKKEIRSEKAKKVLKYLSYFNYNDRGYGKDFSGIEKYQQFEGKQIACLDVMVYKPFGCTDAECPPEVSKAQKFGNAIHFRSREWYIRGDIFFEEGDTVNAMLFADTERLLWARNKFKDVRILVMPDSLQPEKVDVMVYLQDKLSYALAAGYSNNRVMNQRKIKLLKQLHRRLHRQQILILLHRMR